MELVQGSHSRGGRGVVAGYGCPIVGLCPSRVPGAGSVRPRGFGRAKGRIGRVLIQVKILQKKTMGQKQSEIKTFIKSEKKKTICMW